MTDEISTLGETPELAGEEQAAGVTAPPEPLGVSAVAPTALAGWSTLQAAVNETLPGQLASASARRSLAWSWLGKAAGKGR